MHYKLDFSVIFENYAILLDGVWLTLQLSASAMVVALAIAVVTVIARRSSFRLLRWAAKIYIEVIRNTPFLVQIFIIFFGLPAAGVRLGPDVSALIALALNGGAYSAEILRGGVEAIPRGQFEAGSALALGRMQVFFYIILKPALRTIYPALTSQFILILLTSSVVSSISASELTNAGQILETRTFRSFEVYFVITAIYLAMSLSFSQLFSAIYKMAFRYVV